MSDLELTDAVDASGGTPASTTIRPTASSVERVTAEQLQGEGDASRETDTEIGVQQAADSQQQEAEEGTVDLGRTLIQDTNPQQEEVTRGAVGNVRNFFKRNILLIFLSSGWAAAIAFGVLYFELYFKPEGGQVLPTPVVLMIAVKSYPNDTFFNRLYISGNDTSTASAEDDNKANTEPDIKWRTNSDDDDFWYLEVSPIRETRKNCPVSRNGTFGRFDEVPDFNPPNVSSCNLYDFRLVIFNNLTNEFRHGATVHFHGLTPPSNQDGVPFVANANIHPQNLQAYRFNQFTYPGLHWMHAHTGFQQAYGVAAPIVLQHAPSYFDENGFRKEDDLVVMLEEGFIYPKCAYSTDWYSERCEQIKNAKNITSFNRLELLVNRREKPVVHTPENTAKEMRIRFLNGGSEAPWRITNSFAEKNNGTKVTMEIMATDGQDVRRGVTRDEFVLGLANRIDVLLDLRDVDKDILITAVQMKHSGDVTTPALRHIVIRSRKNISGESEQIDIGALPTSDKNKISPILKDFNLSANLTAAHPLSDRTITRSFTIENRGGDQFGGFPLTIYEGLVKNGSNPVLDKLKNLYEVNTYTELNKLKFQLPPFKVYRNRNTQEAISTRRKCTNCTEGRRSGFRNRPNGELYQIVYDDSEATGNNTCCWEWCDVPEENCTDYDLEDVNVYEPNKHYIPVCFGDRVRFLFINTASFEGSEGHPMHLHGHDFVLRELYNVESDYTLVKDTTYKYDISGPKVDTIWVPFNKAVAFDFDAYNAGEHLFHCHNDFHLENGMMTTVRYMHDEYCQEDLPEFVGGQNDFPQQICSMDGCNISSGDELQS